MPEDAPLYDHMRVNEFLRFMAHLKGCSGAPRLAPLATAAERLAAQARGGGADREAVAGLSAARRRSRQALLDDPKLLIFDEPTSGLDPSQVIAIRDLIRELAGQADRSDRLARASRDRADRAPGDDPSQRQASHNRRASAGGRGSAAAAAGRGTGGRGAEAPSRPCRGCARLSSSLNPAARISALSGGGRPASAKWPQQLAAALVGRGFALSELTTVPA